MSSNVLEFPWKPRHLNYEESRPAAEKALSVPISDRPAQARDLHLDDPDLLLCVCEILRSKLETDPTLVLHEGQFFSGFLREPRRAIGLHDEREYFLGELALIAATASRILFHREDARHWLQRAEASFSLVQNASAHWARVTYQRLALALEERRFEEVLELAPAWTENFGRLGMPEDAVKCRFLKGTAEWETGEPRLAIQTLIDVLQETKSRGLVRLTAQALNNLARFHADLGEPESALSYAREALPLLQQVGNHVVLVKLRWTIAELLRKQGKQAAAVGAYREALRDAGELGMRGDVAAIHLVLADVLLEAGQEAQAEWEIRAALPIIDEEKMVPEGIAALSLLRESLRRRQIDKQALRELHGYFQEK